MRFARSQILDCDDKRETNLGASRAVAGRTGLALRPNVQAGRDARNRERFARSSGDRRPGAN